MYKLQRVKWLCTILCVVSAVCAFGFLMYGKIGFRDFAELCVLALIWGVIAYVVRTIEKDY